ncbi:hypothetical protein GCM10028796_01610 [Ramlibacter monticola]|uniref:Uncharacterized protein n=1 Tax=Ramlibacter monticola TaxID=1926872 RepID=A0A937CSJ4_9BURK|nr:hypothetical protein [Ramlibacter monticola]MBL0391545.1 hypothetical protein [Ramlibacter monticola]
MKNELDDAYDAWKAADAAARGIERELDAAWERYDCALGDPPPHEWRQEALRRRAFANERLNVAIELMMELTNIESYPSERRSIRLELELE